jgi:16S rRNA (uracil1498-N3)-methyltransferase
MEQKKNSIKASRAALLTSHADFAHNNSTMHRFFIPAELFKNNAVTINGEQHYQITHVLRLKSGDRITLLDNSGWEFEVEIEHIDKEQTYGKILRKETGQGESATKIKLNQALLKSDKFEFVLQKCVEMGVSVFVPFVSERCVVRKPSEEKIERWQKIIREAAEQSGRSLLPVLSPVVSFQEACETVTKPSILLWEGEKANGLAEILKCVSLRKTNSISLFVGPEGGFSEAEADSARKAGITTVSLGKRILRAETAGVVAVTAILYERGGLG